MALLSSNSASAQKSETAVVEKAVQVDLAREIFTTPLPFWEPFAIEGSVPPTAKLVAGGYIRTSQRSWCESVAPEVLTDDSSYLFHHLDWLALPDGFEPEGKFNLLLNGDDRLTPGVSYTFYFVVYESPPKAKAESATLPAVYNYYMSGRDTSEVNRTIAPQQVQQEEGGQSPGEDAGVLSIPVDSTCFAVLDRHVRKLPKAQSALRPRRNSVSIDDLIPTHAVSIRETSLSSIEQHTELDLGVLTGTSRTGYQGLVTGAHFYFRPRLEDADLLDPIYWRDPLEQIGQRLSLYAGLAVVELNSNTDVPIEKFDLGIPVVGVGIRGILYWPIPWLKDQVVYKQFVQPLRLNAGLMWFQQTDANPLLTEKHTKRDFFFSLTLDFEVGKLFGPIANLLTK